MNLSGTSKWQHSLLLVVCCASFALLNLGISMPPAEKMPVFESILDDPRVQKWGKRGLDHLYNMEREEAAAAFNEIETMYPKHPVGPFLKGLNIWWDVMVDLPNDTHDKAFFREMDSAVRRANRLLKRDRNDFDAMFFKGAALGFSGRLKSNRGRWFKASLDGKNALDYVMAISEKEEENADFGFGRAIYDYFSVVIPEEYPVVKPFMVFMPKGDKARGIENLQRTVDEGYFIKTEAAYFLLQIYYTYEKDFNKSREYVRWLRESHPKNSFFHIYEGRVFFRWGRWSDAQSVFESVLAKYDSDRPGYSQSIGEQALYYLARTHMVYRRYNEALVHLTRLETISEQAGDSSVFKILAYLRLGMTYDALGERDTAVRYYEQVLDLKDWSGAHARAQRYLDTPYRG